MGLITGALIYSIAHRRGRREAYYTSCRHRSLCDCRTGISPSEWARREFNSLGPRGTFTTRRDRVLGLICAVFALAVLILFVRYGLLEPETLDS